MHLGLILIIRPVFPPVIIPVKQSRGDGGGQSPLLSERPLLSSSHSLVSAAPHGSRMAPIALCACTAVNMADLAEEGPTTFGVDLVCVCVWTTKGNGRGFKLSYVCTVKKRGGDVLY